MPLIASVRGIDVATMKTNALAQTIGGQKLHFANAIIAAIGANFKVHWKQNGIAVYTATASGSLTVVNGSDLKLPTIGAPSVNASATITSGSWVFEIEKATDSNVALIMTAGPIGTADIVTLSGNLNGSKTIDHTQIRLKMSPTLDNSTSALASYTAIADVAINMMHGFNDDDVYLMSTDLTFPWARTQAGMTAAGLTSHAFVCQGANPVKDNWADWAKTYVQNADIAAYNDTWTRFQGFIGLFDGTGSGGQTAVNTAVNVSMMEIWVRNQNTKQWNRLHQGTLIDGGRFQKNNGLTVNPTSISARPAANGGIDILVPHKNDLSTLLPRYATQLLTIPNHAEIDCIAVGVKASLVKWNPNDTDDRSSCRLMLIVGGDWQPSNKLTGAIPQAGMSRMVLLSTNERWFAFACLSNARKEYKDAAGTVISTTEYRNNPPYFGS